MQQGKRTDTEESVDGIKSKDEGESPSPQQKDTNGVEEKE